MVRYQVLFFLDTHNTNAIAIKKLCKLNYMYFNMYLVISKQQGKGFYKYNYGEYN